MNLENPAIALSESVAIKEQLVKKVLAEKDERILNLEAELKSLKDTRNGHVIVPLEPTDEMKQAAYKQYDTGVSSISDIYKAMVETARGGK